MVRMSTILYASSSVIRLAGSLFTIWLTLDWRVRKARKAFEKELVAQGMSGEDARRLSAHLKFLKDDFMNTFRRSVIRF